MTTNPEGIIFGKGHHLPDAGALKDFDFRANVLGSQVEGGSFSIAAVPGRPDCVVRIQPLLPHSEDGYYAIAREGIDHFTQMAKSGLLLPAQRYVVHDGLLYTFTERIEGRPLTSKPEDGSLSAPVIDSLSEYYLWVHNNPGQARRFLWDKASPRQHTVLDNSDTVIMHDVGLNFQEARTGLMRRPDSFLYSCGLSLGEWATDAQIESPRNLRRLLAKEPIYSRIMRKLLGDTG